MNRPALLALGAILAGFGVGYILGFGIGQATRSRLGESVQTRMDGGTLTVVVPVKDAVIGGVVDYFAR